MNGMRFPDADATHKAEHPDLRWGSSQGFWAVAGKGLKGIRGDIDNFYR